MRGARIELYLEELRRRFPTLAKLADREQRRLASLHAEQGEDAFVSRLGPSLDDEHEALPTFTVTPPKKRAPEPEAPREKSVAQRFFGRGTQVSDREIKPKRIKCPCACLHGKDPTIYHAGMSGGCYVEDQALKCLDGWLVPKAVPVTRERLDQLKVFLCGGMARHRAKARMWHEGLDLEVEQYELGRRR